MPLWERICIGVIAAAMVFGLGFFEGLDAKEAAMPTPRLANCLEALQATQAQAAESGRLTLRAACGKFCGDFGLKPRTVTVRGHDPETFNCICGGELLPEPFDCCRDGGEL